MDRLKTLATDLEKIGLSKNEALIYVILATKGELRIQEITTLTGIPRSSVYESIKSLSRLGLIEQIIDHKFVRLKPYPISTLKHGLKEKLTYIQTQLSEIENLEQAVPVSPSHSTNRTIIRYYKNVSGARQLFWNTLKAQTQVCVYSAFGRSKFLGKNFYMDFVQESSERNISERVLINPTPRALELIKRDQGTPLARTRQNDIRVLGNDLLSIDGETFIYNNIYSQVKLDGLEISGFEVESHSSTEMQRSIFETLWNQAKPVVSYL